MKTKLFLFISLTFIGYSYAQIGFEERIIQENADGPYSVYTADINNDGFMDVISCSVWGNKVFWHENTDGQGAFETHLIQDNANGTVSVFAADIDGDGDMDVLSASDWGGTVAWYKNDGEGNFVTHIIRTNVDNVIQVHAADIDGDGDMDVLSASWGDDTIAWYENKDGQGNFVMHVISTSQDGSRSVYTADLNGDGYMDVIAASQVDGKVAWYKNIDGQGLNWEENIILTYDSAWRVTASDLDGDGDKDVIALLDDSRIDWYENVRQGEFIVHELSTNANGGEGVYAVDMDNDGDNDVLCATFFGHKIIWYENLDEEGSDWEEHIIQEGVFNASSVHAADINDDGYMDVIATGRAFHKVVWYEQGILGVNENTLSEFSVYPSPTSGILNIKSKTNIVQIELYNQLGQLVLSSKHQKTIDLSSVSQGIYFIKIKDENGNIGTQKVVKK